MDPTGVISQGWLKERLADSGQTSIDQPILQCVQIKPLGTTQDRQDRFRLVLSDVRNFIQCMLNVALNELVHSGKLARGCIVRLKAHQLRAIKDKPVFIIQEIEVLDQHGIHEKIGNPVVQEISNLQTTDSAISTTGFYGAKPEPKHEQKYEPKQEPKTQPSTFNKSNDSAYGYIHPIESISPYSNKWTIKARVINKSEIRHWHNRNGEGKLFSVTLLDESGEIKATAFNDQVDAFYELFQEGSVYYISTPCKCQLAKKQYSNVNNDYELSFDNNTRIEKSESQNDVPQIQYNFTPVGNLQSIEKDAVIDMIGVLREIGEVSELISKTTQKPYSKRELTLVDNTNFSVRVTIWGNTAGNFNAPVESIVAFKGLKVSDFGGRSLSLQSSGTISIDPDVAEAHSLKGWYEAQGKNDQFSTHVNAGGADGGGRSDQFKTVAAVKEENLGMSEKGDYFTIKATVIHVNSDNFSYPGCLSEGCSKKVIETEDGQWRCEKCNINHPKPSHRYVLRVLVSDYTGQIYLSCFSEPGTVIMGMSADKVKELEENDAHKDAFMGAVNQRYTLTCRAKQENYGEQLRIKYQCIRLAPFNYAAEATKLMEKIKLYD